MLLDLTAIFHQIAPMEPAAKKPRRSKNGPSEDKQSKRLVCQACRARPGPENPWAEVEWRGRSETPIGSRCRSCSELHAAAFEYMHWDEFCKMSESEETGDVVVDGVSQS